MNSQQSEVRLLPPDTKIDLHDLLARFIRRLPVFLVIAVIVMAAVVAYTLTQTPYYTATSSVVIEPRTTEIVTSTPVVSDLPANNLALDTEAKTLNSEQVAERVVRRMSLHLDPEFNSALAEDPTLAKAIAVDGQKAREAIKQTALALQNRTTVERSGLTFVIDVAFTSLDPNKAAKIANAIVEEYVSSQVESVGGTTRSASQWLRGRLDELQRDLQANEAAVQQFKIAHNMMSAEGATMAEQEVSNLNQQVATAEADLAEKRARLGAARAQILRGGGGGDTRAALDSSVVSALRGQQAALDVRIAELQTKYGPRHPELQAAQQKSREIEQQVQSEIARQISGLEAEVRVAEQRHGSLMASRGRSQGTLSSNSRAEVTLNELQRKADASRAIYQAFLSRANETAAQEGLQRPQAKVSAWAKAPNKPSLPNRPLNFALGLVLALAAGGGAVLLLETMDGSLRTSKDVESKLKVPSLGSIPMVPKAPPAKLSRYVIDRPFSVFAESLRGLKSSVWAFTKGAPNRVIALTSAMPGEGKTLTTLAFGRSLAQGGERTLIIDADLRRRMLSVALRRQVAVGLVEVLEGRARLDQAVIKDEPSGAYVLPLSDKPPPSKDLFHSRAIDALLEQLKPDFDIIILDTAPVLAVADTRAIAAKADGVVLLVRWGRTPRQAVAAALDLLQTAGASIIGTCLTIVDLSKQARVGYGDALYYQGAMSRYYAE